METPANSTLLKGRDAFIVAASVPLVGSHASGDLAAATAILTALPELPQVDFFCAVILGEETVVRRFLAQYPDYATTKGGPHGWDPLTYLCFSRYLRLDPARSAGFVGAATALLDAGANPNTGWFEAGHQPNPTWESVIYGAAGLAYHAELTRLLLARGADPNDDETPYHASESWNNTALKVLVESGRLTAGNLETMLLRKADCHDREGMAYLLQHGVSPNNLGRWPWTPLHQALRRDNDVAMIELLLDHQGDMAVKTRDGRSGFTIAAQRGRADVLAACAKRGLADNLDGVDRLLAACARGDTRAVRALTDRDKPLVRELLAVGGARLAEFSSTGNASGVQQLLELGVPADSRYEGDGYFGIAKNSTALHVAAWRGRPTVVRLLLEQGAAVEARDDHGRTPLMLAVRACVDSYWMVRRSPDSVAALLRRGASVRGIKFPCGYEPVDDLLRQAGATEA